MSSATAECVSAPIEMKSGRARPYAGSESRVTPPEISTGHAPAMASTASSTCAGFMLSSSTRHRRRALPAPARACRARPRPLDQPGAPVDRKGRLPGGVIVLVRRIGGESQWNPPPSLQRAARTTRQILRCRRFARRPRGFDTPRHRRLPAVREKVQRTRSPAGSRRVGRDPASAGRARPPPSANRATATVDRPAGTPPIAAACRRTPAAGDERPALVCVDAGDRRDVAEQAEVLSQRPRRATAGTAPRIQVVRRHVETRDSNGTNAGSQSPQHDPPRTRRTSRGSRRGCAHHAIPRASPPRARSRGRSGRGSALRSRPRHPAGGRRRGRPAP